MFARPQVDGEEPDEYILEGVELEELVELAESQAREGRVKTTLVVDDTTRVRIDARYGKARVQRLDAPTVKKMMGGKERPLRPDESGALLRVIGIANADGTISARNAKKYKQVNHLVELCRPVWERAVAARSIDEGEPLRVLDLACGNSYLTFVLAEALRLEGIPAQLHGLDRNPEVIDRSRERAQSLGFDHATFSVGGIVDATRDLMGGVPDIVIVLHACDTATDDALAFAAGIRAPAILAAPCCQRELASQLSGDAWAPTPAIDQHGLLKREFAATLTDGLRSDALVAMGYKVDAVEFIGSEHTPKNLLLRARLTASPRQQRAEALVARCRDLGVQPRTLSIVASLIDREPG